MGNSLSHQHCVPCEGGTKPLTRAEFSVCLPLVPDWKIIDDLAITKTFEFKDFTKAMGFVVQIGLIAQKEGHHPDINLHDFKKVTINLSTHAIGGLSVNDFILATKIDELRS